MSNIFVVSAPSGAGKTSLVKALIESVENLSLPVSHTTRKKRNKEINGESYHFVNEKTFFEMVESQQMVEYAKVFDNFYGVSSKELSDSLSMHKDIILEIDWQGARSIKSVFSQVVSIFIMPPSLDVLRQRLIKRGQDNKETIAVRMSAAKAEMGHSNEYDYVVINDSFDESLLRLIEIIRNNR